MDKILIAGSIAGIAALAGFYLLILSPFDSPTASVIAAEPAAPGRTCDNFNIIYKFHYDDTYTLNTASDTYTIKKCCSSNTYDMELTDEEMCAIYDAVMEHGLLNLEDEFTENCDSEGNCKKADYYAILTIYRDGKSVKSIRYDEEYFYDDDPELKEFLEAKEVIDEIVWQKERELELPAPSCSYTAVSA